MSRATELLEQATPLPWGYSMAGLYLAKTDQERADARLIHHAVNRLPDYEAAVEALERLTSTAQFVSNVAVEDVPSEESWGDLDHAVDKARAALTRLRDEVPA